MWHHGFMPKRIRKPDVAQNALRVVEQATGGQLSSGSTTLTKKALISQIMSEMGKKGGREGGKVRASRMTPEARSQSASNAAKARWGKQTEKE